MEKRLEQFLMVNAPLSGFTTSLSFNISETNSLSTSSVVISTPTTQLTSNSISSVTTMPTTTLAQTVNLRRNFVLPLQTGSSASHYQQLV